MNKDRLLAIVRNPQELDPATDLEVVKELIETFPYFPSAYGWLARMLTEEQSIYTDRYIKLGAAYAGDRALLYALVHGEEPTQVPEEDVTSFEPFGEMAPAPVTFTDSLLTLHIPESETELAEESAAHEEIYQETPTAEAIIQDTAAEYVPEQLVVAEPETPAILPISEETAYSEPEPEISQEEVLTIPEEPELIVVSVEETPSYIYVQDETPVVEQEVIPTEPEMASAEMDEETALITEPAPLPWLDTEEQSFAEELEATFSDEITAREESQPESAPEAAEELSAPEPELEEEEYETPSTPVSSFEPPLPDSESQVTSPEKPVAEQEPLRETVLPLAAYDYFAFLEHSQGRGRRKPASEVPAEETVTPAPEAEEVTSAGPETGQQETTTPITEVAEQPEIAAPVISQEETLEAEPKAVIPAEEKASRHSFAEWLAMMKKDRSTQPVQVEAQTTAEPQPVPPATEETAIVQPEEAEKQATATAPVHNEVPEAEIPAEIPQKQEISYAPEISQPAETPAETIPAVEQPAAARPMEPESGTDSGQESPSDQQSSSENTEYKPVEPKKPSRSETEDIISNFIKTEPRIKKPQAKIFSPEDMAQRSVAEDLNLATETLAKIYLKQGLHTKAIEIYQQLILRFPQKSRYFALRIEEIKALEK